MVPNHMMRQRIDMVAFQLALLGLVGSLRAEGITPSTPKSPSAATRTLSFPSSPCVGNLYLEPESGVSWNPEYVRPERGGEYFSAAQGEVRVPGNRKVRLILTLALSPAEAARLRAENPWAYQQTIADKIRKNAADLSGLAKLEPNDLHFLEVGSEMYRRTGVSPEVFAPLRHLTGLEILNLQTTGVTDEGLQHLRALQALKGLELTQFPVGSRGLAVLEDLPALEYLALNTNVTDAGLKQVAQLSHLRWLRIVDGKMWGPGFAAAGSSPAGTSPEAALVIVTSRSYVGEVGGNGFAMGDGTLVVTCDHLVFEESASGGHRAPMLVTVFSPYLGDACEARTALRLHDGSAGDREKVERLIRDLESRGQ